MNPQPYLDFLEFALLPFLSHKDIQLLQLKLTRAKTKNQDPFFLDCFYFKKCISLIKKQKRPRPHHSADPNLSLYHSLVLQDPEDLFLILAETRYHLKQQLVSLVLNRPADSIHFKKIQLCEELNKEIPGKKIDYLINATLTDLYQLVEHDSSIKTPAIKIKLSSLSSLPSPVRFILEMGLVFIFLFFIMWLVPEIRNTYETSVQKRINEYLIDSSLIDSPAPAGIKKPTPIPPSSDEMDSADASHDKAEPPIPADTPAHKQPKVSDGETWRFSFAGQGQTDLETEVTELLKSALKDQVKPSLVPGGIQFDFVLPTQKLIELKSNLENLTASLQRKSSKSTNAVSPTAVNLSWYKKRNMGTRKIPSAHVQVIIWISTL